MTLNTNLTDNELKAALVLVKSCLDGMGGSRPADLGGDEYTWVSAKDLMAAGWNKNEATGTFGALMDKGFVSEYDKNEWVLETEAWKYLDTIWDAQTATPKETAVKTVTLNLANTTFAVHASEEAAQAVAGTDVLVIKAEADLLALSGPQSVAFYNVTAAAISPSLAEVKRFADKASAAKRLWANLQDLTKMDPATAETVKEEKIKVKADKARDGAKPAHKDDHPAPKPAAKRATGINLPPMKVAYPCREGSKQAILVDMLSRVQGATMPELLKALSGGEKPWLEISVKSGMNWDMNKIKGYGIRTTKRAEFDCYHLVLPKGMDKPHPHQPLKKSPAKTEDKKEG